MTRPQQSLDTGASSMESEKSSGNKVKAGFSACLTSTGEIG